MRPPKVSVCIPTYNYSEYLPFAIESILAQDFRDYELIIIDDCSTDNTEQTVKDYLADSRVKFFKNEKNLGLAGNWNRCMAKARGDYIKFVLADDALASNGALGRMVSVLDSDSTVSLVASARNIINEHSQPVKLMCEFKKGFSADGSEIIRLCMLKQANLIGEPTVTLFRRSAAQRGFDPKLVQLIDLEMWFHLLEKGNFVFLDEMLASFRVHSRQKTSENIANLVHFDEFCLILDTYLSKPYVEFRTLTKYYLRMEAVYQFWKSAKKGLIDRSGGIERIRAHFSVPLFFFLLPLYKTIKPWFKLSQKLAKKLGPY